MWYSRMWLFGHVEHSTGWIAEVCNFFKILLQAECGCTEKTWQANKNNRNKLGIDSADPQNHSEWRGRGRLWRKTLGG